MPKQSKRNVSYYGQKQINRNYKKISSINTKYNEQYYDYLRENTYNGCLKDTSDYIEGHINKEYYSLDEIRELEPQIAESLKIINSAKVKIK